MDRVHFLLGVHNHQPIGNFGFVFEKAYARSYLPFLEAMERHPRLHWNMHTTGILWDWLEDHHPEYIDRVAEQVRTGQLEILTGGYYEPIMPALPDADKVGQIRKLTGYVQKRFGVTPKGMWLAERVWEPHLPRVLREAGVEFTLLDDSHLLSTGLTEDQMCGAFMTEEQGATLSILPIRKDLRYAIPFKDPGETLTLLRRFASPSAHRALVMVDDGEKFGLWPNTYDHVYKDGWLERFLTVLESNADWIHCSRISDYLASTVPQGRVYVPTASYYEMSEWTLPAASQEALTHFLTTLSTHNGDADMAKRFLRGGFWRNFLNKYEEANNLHKKMLWVSEKVHKAVKHMCAGAPRLSAKAQKLLDTLWAGQCNCAYWHGVFGGLYLPHLRQAIYKQLLDAEDAADKVLRAGMMTVFEKDFDKDGIPEVLLETPTQNVYISPEHGGSIFEWDLRGTGINLLNVLTRRAEGYHRQLLEHETASPEKAAAAAGQDGGGVKTIHDIVRVKEPGLEKRLHVDWYRRSNLLDHFLQEGTTLDQFYRCHYGEQGDFVNTGYLADIRRELDPVQVRLHRTGTVWSGDQRNAIRIEKTVSLCGPTAWQVEYRIENVEGPACRLHFGGEMSFAFTEPDHTEPVDLGFQGRWQRTDPNFGTDVQVVFETPMTLWEFPLETVSLSEEGFERTYQGTVILAHALCELPPGQSARYQWRVEASKR